MQNVLQCKMCHLANKNEQKIIGDFKFLVLYIIVLFS